MQHLPRDIFQYCLLPYLQLYQIGRLRQVSHSWKNIFTGYYSQQLAKIPCCVVSYTERLKIFVGEGFYPCPHAIPLKLTLEHGTENYLRTLTVSRYMQNREVRGCLSNKNFSLGTEQIIEMSIATHGATCYYISCNECPYIRGRTGSGIWYPINVPQKSLSKKKIHVPKKQIIREKKRQWKQQFRR